MPSQNPTDDRSRLNDEVDGGSVTLTRETELLREIARALAREAAREEFERRLATVHHRGRVEEE